MKTARAKADLTEIVETLKRVPPARLGAVRAVVRALTKASNDPTKPLRTTKKKPSLEALLMQALEKAAAAHEDAAFVALANAVNWSSQPAETVMHGVKLALKAGAFLFARELSADGSKRYPEHAELAKAARILAPPKVIRSDLPPRPWVKANREWLKEHARDYRGRWVALRKGKLAAVADSFEEVVAHVGNVKGVLLTKV
jgi:hypothetical protein